MLRLRRWVADAQIEIVLSLLTPYAAYWPPEHLGGSGVLATVVAGLYVSWNGFSMISAATRLQGVFFWDVLVYLIEGIVFLMTGLQARTLIYGLGQIFVVRARGLCCGCERRGDPGSFRVDFPGHLSAALAESRARAQGPLAAVDVAIRARIHRAFAVSCLLRRHLPFRSYWIAASHSPIGI